MADRSVAESGAPAQIDLTLLRAWLARAAERLRAQEAAINALNVFPVPDGDTGTNLLLTLQAAAAALDDLPTGSALGVAVRRLAQGALLGARGNSGVILSQQLRGLRLPPRTLAPRASAMPAALLPELLTAMAQSGRLAVAHPVDGTMLTVLADAALAAQRHDPSDLAGVIRVAAAAARTSLDRTRDLLPALSEAGVVDAGGAGIVALMDALLEVVTGEQVAAPAALGAVPRTQMAACEDEGIEVMALVHLPDERVAALERDLRGVGTSVAMAGGEGLWQVHVHVADGAVVDAVVDACRTHGVIDQVRTMDLSLSPAHQIHDSVTHARAVVVGVLGEGLLALVRDHGGIPLTPSAGLRPSVADVLDVLMRAHDSGVREIIMLPSDRDSLAAVHLAVTQFDRQRTQDVSVAVVATESIVQSLAALAVHDATRGFPATLSAMDEVASATQCAGIARASRSAVMSGHAVQAGQIIGVVTGEVTAVGDDLSLVALEVIEHLLADTSEVVTVLVGADCADADVERLRAWAATQPHLSVEIILGGQPAWPLIVGVA